MVIRQRGEEAMHGSKIRQLPNTHVHLWKDDDISKHNDQKKD